MSAVTTDTRTGQRGSVIDWVDVFTEVWQAPRERLDRLLALLDDEVVLRVPTTPPVSRGKAAGCRAFEHAFCAMPDLRAEVHRWSADGEMLFIEMGFTAAIAGKPITWRNVDRFIFRNGSAVERVAFFNPIQVRRAFLMNPNGWLQLAKLRTVA